MKMENEEIKKLAERLSAVVPEDLRHGLEARLRQTISGLRQPWQSEFQLVANAALTDDGDEPVLFLQNWLSEYCTRFQYMIPDRANVRRSEQPEGVEIDNCGVAI